VVSDADDVGAPRLSNVARVDVATAPVGGHVEMIPIIAGSFAMGSPTNEPGRSSWENRRTASSGNVSINSFNMGVYPVTQAQYEAVIGINPSAHRVGGERESFVEGLNTDNFPVEQINWYEAIVFCNILSMMEGLSPAYEMPNVWPSPASWTTDPDTWGTIPTSIDTRWNNVRMISSSNGYRLPTEAQWEYACRAGTTSIFYWGTGQVSSDQANFDASKDLYNGSPAGVFLNRTTQVGSYAPNPWGLYDMAGNVIVWCWDWYVSSYNSAGGSNNPTGPASGDLRIARGGSWFNVGVFLRSANRNANDPFFFMNRLGIRLVRP